MADFRSLPRVTYAQVVEEKRFFLPEVLVSRYFIAGLNSPPPLSEREELTLRPFRAVVDCLSRREPKTPTRFSSAMLPVVPEGRVLAVVTHGDQALSVSSPEVSSTPADLRGQTRETDFMGFSFGIFLDGVNAA